MLKKILEYSITFVACSILVVIILLAKRTFFLTEVKTILHHLVDAFFIVGIICASFGAFVFVSNEGAFDFFVYGIRRFFSLFLKDHNKVKYKTYYDYHIAKAERPKADFLYMVLVGVLFIVVSLILLAFWDQAPEVVAA